MTVACKESVQPFFIFEKNLVKLEKWDPQGQAELILNIIEISQSPFDGIEIATWFWYNSAF